MCILKYCIVACIFKYFSLLYACNMFMVLSMIGCILSYLVLLVRLKSVNLADIILVVATEPSRV